MKIFGKSIIETLVFSVTDTQLVLNENKALKTDLSRSEELNRELVKALTRISLDGCGCSGYCHCTNDGGTREEFLRIWKEETQSIAEEVLKRVKEMGK